jgi:hypothetical protein
MSDAFRQLCAEVDRATQTTSSLEQCRPHYQRVLDYIRAHPEERDIIAALLARHVRVGYVEGGLRSDISLVQFLMAALKWPEVRAAAEESFDDGGNASRAHELQELLGVYDAA